MLPLPPQGNSESHEGGMQMPWRVGLLRGEDLLESHATIPQGGQRHQGEI